MPTAWLQFKPVSQMRCDVCSTDQQLQNIWIYSTVQWLIGTYEVLPLGVQVGLVGQAALHDVGAVVGTGFDGGQASAVGAVNQLHQGLHTLWTQRHLVVDRECCISRNTTVVRSHNQTTVKGLCELKSFNWTPSELKQELMQEWGLKWF